MMCVFSSKIVIYSNISLGMISGQDCEEEQFGLNPLESYTEYKRDTRCELLFLWPILTIIMLMLFVASFFFAINASMMWKKLMWKNWQVQGRSNRRDNEYGDVVYGMGPRNKIDQEVVKEVNQNADPEVDLKGNRYIDALQKKIPQSKAITTDEQLLIDTENLNNMMRCLNIADNSVSDDLKTNNLIDEMLPIDNDIYAKEDDVSNIQEKDITYLSAEREHQNKEKSTLIQPNLIIINNIISNTDNTKTLKITDGLMNYKDINKLVGQQIKSCAKSLIENKNTLQINELFVNKSLIQNSESDPEIVMKISNQSNYGQSVFSPKEDFSSDKLLSPYKLDGNKTILTLAGDSQENNARKILKSSQSDGTFDIDLAINDNLSSSSSQIFRAPRYNDSSNDSKLSPSGNCLIRSGISEIPEKSVELFVNKSFIQNSESDPEIVMKISNQSNYGQSVFSPKEDFSSDKLLSLYKLDGNETILTLAGDAQENNARKIIKSSQSDGTFDIDLAINNNLSSTSSQIFRAPRYNDSSNDSKSSLSDNCLIDSDIFKIPEKTSENNVDFIDIADEDFHPNTPEKREAENSPDEIVEVVLYDPDGNPVNVKFRVLSDV